MTSAGSKSDPVKIVLEAAAARETLLRARINDAAKANLVSFARRGPRAPGRLLRRHPAGRRDGCGAAQAHHPGHPGALAGRLEILVPGGGTARRRAHPRRRRLPRRVLPMVHVAVLSSENGGIADQAMLEAVGEEVQVG